MIVWGIDPDTKNITLAGSDGNWAIVEGGKKQRAEDRIRELWRGMEDWLRGMRAVSEPPVYVYVEKPMMTRNAAATIAQAQVIGIIRAELWRANIPNSLVDPGVWKKEMLGNGHATKEEIKDLALRIRPELGSDLAQDVYDAFIIARWGLSRLGAASSQS